MAMGPGLTLVVDSFHPEMAKTLQEAARHGDLRALERTVSAPADPNQAPGAGDGDGGGYMSYIGVIEGLWHGVSGHVLKI